MGRDLVFPSRHVAERRQQVERSVADMMRDRRVLHDPVKKEREARFAVAHDALCPAECRDGRGALVAVQVDDEVEMARPDLAADEAPESRDAIVFAVLLDEQAFVDVRIVLHELAQAFVREHRDACLRIVRAQRTQHRRHEHEIADMHEVDDENVLIGSAGCHSPLPSIS